MIQVKMKPIARALELVRTLAGTGAAAIERRFMVAKADFIAECGLHQSFKEAAVRVGLRK
jgi:hypothetical protein